ncbi:MAG: dockerin type I domain-containing protein, partial [Planctomycetota bacterium]
RAAGRLILAGRNPFGARWPPMSVTLRLFAALLVGSLAPASAFELVIPEEGAAPKPAGNPLHATLQNGGFEESAEQDALPPAWKVLGASSTPSSGARVTLDQPRSGRASLALRAGGGDAGLSGVRQCVAVTPGQWVRVEAWALAPGDDPLPDSACHAAVELSFHATRSSDSRRLPGSNSKRIADARSPIDEWTRTWLTVRVPADATEARVALALMHPKDAAGSVRVDDVSLRVIPQPPNGELPGDFNRDGRVDAADYTVWRDASSGLMPPEYTAKADANGDGVVDDADRQVWDDHVGLIADPEE